MRPGRVLVGAIAVLAFAGCGERLSPPSQAAEVLAARDEAAGGIVQTVLLSADQVRKGDRLRIESRITNEGPMPAMVLSRVCTLDLETPMHMELLSDEVRCLAYSMRGALAPGESRIEVEERLITADPGVYLMRVRHLLDPRHAAIFRITVLPQDR
jgi:hypothetical protein